MPTCIGSNIAGLRSAERSHALRAEGANTGHRTPHSRDDAIVQTPRLNTFRYAVTLLALGCVAHSAPAQGTAPTRANVEAVLKSTWDRTASSTNVRQALTLNSVRFGKPARATAQEVVEGIPRNGQVTPAIVDFTVRSHYNTETQVMRRVREAFVYRDRMGDWAVMTGSVRGQDVSTTEPPGK